MSSRSFYRPVVWPGRDEALVHAECLLSYGFVSNADSLVFLAICVPRSEIELVMKQRREDRESRRTIEDWKVGLNAVFFLEGFAGAAVEAEWAGGMDAYQRD